METVDALKELLQLFYIVFVILTAVGVYFPESSVFAFNGNAVNSAVGYTVMLLVMGGMTCIYGLLPSHSK